MLLNTHPTRVVMNDGREAEFQLGRYGTGAVAVRAGRGEKAMTLCRRQDVVTL